jgi:hypothetical protein
MTRAWLIGLVGLLWSGCDPTRDEANALEGEWQATSVPVDGQEQLSDPALSWERTCGPAGYDSGDLTWCILRGISMLTRLRGEYEFRKAGDVLRVRFSQGSLEGLTQVDFELEVDDQRLRLESQAQEPHWRIEARR